MIKLNVGCGSDLKQGYVNIDMHTTEEIEARYGAKMENDLQIFHYNVFNLPYKDGEVDEVLCHSFVEHLSFQQEGMFLQEVCRVLKKGGLFHFTVPDFETLVHQWIKAEDNFKDFYKTGTEEHWFGNGDRNINNRWGYLTATIFGNQNGDGQFHKNAYTRKKIDNIMKMLGFKHEISEFLFKNTEINMLECKGIKL